MRKSRLHLNILLLGIVCLLAGCGSSNAGTEKSRVVVSGAAVSGGAANAGSGNENKIKTRYSNGDNIYEVDYECEDPGFFQYKWDGTKVEVNAPMDVKKFVWKENFYLLWVDDQWIYYNVCDFNVFRDEMCEGSALWRVPIEKQKDGDRPLWDKKEKILEKNGDFWIEDFFYAEDDFIVYEALESGRTNFYRYNLNTKEQVPLWKKGKSGDIYNCLPEKDFIRMAEQGICILQEDDPYQETVEALYVLDLKEWETRKIYEWNNQNENGSIWISAEPGGVFFVPEDYGESSVWGLQEGEDKAHCFIRKKQIEKKLKEIDPWGMKEKKYDWTISYIHLYQGRIYLELTVNWQNKQQDYVGALIISSSIGKMSDLRYEEEMTQWLKNSDFEEGWYVGNDMWFINENIEGWIGDNIFVGREGFNPDMNNQYMYYLYMYDISTGKSRIISEKDIEYWQLRFGEYVEADLDLDD